MQLFRETALIHYYKRNYPQKHYADNLLKNSISKRTVEYHLLMPTSKEIPYSDIFTVYICPSDVALTI